MDRAPATAPLTLIYQQQEWVNDYAVDTGSPLRVDISDLAVGDSDFRATLDRIAYDEKMDLDPHEDDLMAVIERENGSSLTGPYRLELQIGLFATDDTEELTLWLEANPAWSQGQEHPMGGYVRVDAQADGVRYLDAGGRLHREDGPAVERFGAGMVKRQWCRHGTPFNPAGPAAEWTEENGLVTYQDFRDEEGWLHRAEGPAVVRGDGSREWHVHGKMIAVQEPASKFAPVRFTMEGAPILG